MRTLTQFLNMALEVGMGISLSIRLRFQNPKIELFENMNFLTIELPKILKQLKILTHPSLFNLPN